MRRGATAPRKPYDRLSVFTDARRLAQARIAGTGTPWKRAEQPPFRPSHPDRRLLNAARVLGPSDDRVAVAAHAGRLHAAGEDDTRSRHPVEPAEAAVEAAGNDGAARTHPGGQRRTPRLELDQ